MNTGSSFGAFKSNAACCSVETGFKASDVLSTFPNPTIAALTPVTVPVNTGSSFGALDAIESVTVVAKFASAPRAEESSFNVSNVVGATSTKLLIANFTKAVVAI